MDLDEKETIICLFFLLFNLLPISIDEAYFKNMLYKDEKNNLYSHIMCYAN